jgi:hypothetical protein
MVRQYFLARGQHWVQSLVERAVAESWGTNAVAGILGELPANRDIWDIAASLGADIENFYWRRIFIYGIQEDSVGVALAIEKLMAAGRMREAVNRHGINERITRFAAVMDELDPRANRELPTAGVDLSNSEQAQFREELNDPLYLKTRVCKAVLQRLDEALSAGGASYDELVSIEHVLPQTVDPGSEWARLFPVPAQRDEWTHRLANLVFLTRRINTRASNWDFDRKKREYFASEDGTSPFPLTQAVLQAGQWSVEHLTERQEKLIKRLAQVWQL